MASVSDSVLPTEVVMTENPKVQDGSFVKNEKLEENGVLIECYTAPNTSEEDNEDDVSIYYEEELMDDDDDLTNDHDIDSYDEVTVGEEEQDEEVSEEEEIVELSEADEEDAMATSDDRSRIMEDSMDAFDDSSTAAPSTDHMLDECMSGTLHDQMQSAITEGARKAMMEQIAREQILQRQLLQQETDKLKDGLQEPQRKVAAARSTLLKEIQRINEAVSNNAVAKANAAKLVYRTTNTESKNKALAKLRRQVAREELARKNDSLLKSSISTADMGNFSKNSPRSVSQHQDGSRTIISPSSNGNKYKDGLAKLGSLNMIVAPLDLEEQEEEDSCITSNAHSSQYDSNSKLGVGENTTIAIPISREDAKAKKKKNLNKADTPCSLACVLPGDYSLVCKKVCLESTSAEAPLDNSAIVESVIISIAEPTVSGECATVDSGIIKSVAKDVVKPSVESKVDFVHDASNMHVHGSEEVSFDSDASYHPMDLLSNSSHATASHAQEQSVTNETSSVVSMTPRVVKKNTATSLIHAFESSEFASTPSPAKKSITDSVTGRLPIPAAFMASPNKASADTCGVFSSASPSKHLAFSPRKMTAQVPSAFKTFQKTALKQSAPPSPPPFSSHDSGDYHSLEDLQSGKAKGVDITRREQYLSPQEFHHHFKMSKEEFAKLPKWKQDKTKRAFKLF
jgi:hypothetical protein